MFRRMTATLVAAATMMAGLVAGTLPADAASSYCGAIRVAPASWTVTDSNYSNVITRFIVPSDVTSWTAALTTPSGRIPVGTSLVATSSSPRWNMVSETLYKWGFRAGHSYRVTFVGSRSAANGGQCTQVLTGTVHLRTATAVSAKFSADSASLSASGTLKRTDWKSGTMSPFANRTVTLQWRKNATVSTWTTKATVKTNSAGRYSFKVRRAPGQWRVISGSTVTYAASSKLFALANN